MPRPPPRPDLVPHGVANQPPPRGSCDLWAEDAVLRDHARGADTAALAAFGTLWGSEAVRDAGRAANRHPPEPKFWDAGGRRLDEVEFHPAYHDLLAEGIGAGYAALPWEGAPGGHATHAAMVYMVSQADPGVCCPMTMTYAAVPALRADPAVEDRWRPRLLSRDYDPRVLPLGEKRGATMGMAMTEKQGGSDLRGTATRAEPADGHFRLTGHKWFCSAPMSDGFLTLAQAPGGLTCFLVPRWLEGERNAIRLVRLKDKLGNRSNASAEIAYEGARAHRLGPEGEGIRTILEMVRHTRLDTAVAPAGLMRAALAQARHWTEHRRAFQRRLIDQPLMRSVLADLVLDWEGATALAFRIARAFDAPAERAFARVGVALAKYLNNKLCPRVVGEALEALGGMGYVADTSLPLLWCEAPLNGIWEGAGNVICLDILRTLARVPDAAPALAAELDAGKGASRAYDTALALHRTRWPALPEEAEARWFAERTALLLTASVLLRQSPPAVADAFVATRLAGDRGHVAGAVGGLDAAAILARL
jgi:putative acyl-CoA dehydrogenase